MNALPLAVCVTLCTFALSVQAVSSLPSGAAVASGSAIISQSGNVMTVASSSNRTIVNWNTFSIDAGKTVQFTQPGASSAVLNRVVSASPSQILGQIVSNGQVFLVNPNGIQVGSSGSIVAPGIYLSTGAISDADFLASTIHFDPPPNGVSITLSGQLNATGQVVVYSAQYDGSSGFVNAPQINIDDGRSVTPPATIPGTSSSPSTLPGATILPLGGSIAISPGSNGANLQAQNLNIQSSGTLTLNGVGATPAAPSLLRTVTMDPATQRVLQRTGGAIALRAPASALVATPSSPPQVSVSSPVAEAPRGNAPLQAAVPGATSVVRPITSGGLVDGAVTVRVSLVDASTIVLR